MGGICMISKNNVQEMEGRISSKKLQEAFITCYKWIDNKPVLLIFERKTKKLLLQVLVYPTRDNSITDQFAIEFCRLVYRYMSECCRNG